LKYRDVRRNKRKDGMSRAIESVCPTLWKREVLSEAVILSGPLPVGGDVGGDVGEVELDGEEVGGLGCLIAEAQLEMNTFSTL
jgi:hypothetical protein